MRRIRFLLAKLVVLAAVGTGLAQYGDLGDLKILKPEDKEHVKTELPFEGAIVLFDGANLSQFNGGEKWLIEDGVATVHGGGVTSKRAFGSCQLHVEWAAPAEATGHGQGRGNSGIYLQGKYEVQILDSYENKTYYDGQAGLSISSGRRW